MKPLSVLPFVLALAAAGCEKPSDLAPLAEEATGVVKTYRPRIAELENRSDNLIQRGLALKLDGPEVAPASDLLGNSRLRLNELKQALDGAKGQIAAAEKAGKPEDLLRFLHRLRTQLADGRLTVNADLDTVEAWLARVENRPRLQQAPPPTTPPSDPGTGAPAPTQ